MPHKKKLRQNLGVAQMEARYLGVVEAAGSSPVTQTKQKRWFYADYRVGGVFCFCQELGDFIPILKFF